MRKIIISSLFFCFVISCKSSKELHNHTGYVEIKAIPKKQEYAWSEASSIKVEFYLVDNKTEKMGLMPLSINGIQFITDIEGNFERTLFFGKEYEFRFYGPGVYELYRTIKIEKGYEYLIKIFMERKQENLY